MSPIQKNNLAEDPSADRAKCRFHSHQTKASKQPSKNPVPAIKMPTKVDNGSKTSASKKEETKAPAKSFKFEQAVSSVLIQVSKGKTYADFLEKHALNHRFTALVSIRSLIYINQHSLLLLQWLVMY